MATYYGIEHTYGANAIDSKGDHIGRLHAFENKRERDEWVAEGNSYSTQSGARTAATLRDRRDARLIRRELGGGYDFGAVVRHTTGEMEAWAEYAASDEAR